MIFVYIDNMVRENYYRSHRDYQPQLAVQRNKWHDKKPMIENTIGISPSYQQGMKDVYTEGTGQWVLLLCQLNPDPSAIGLVCNAQTIIVCIIA